MNHRNSQKRIMYEYTTYSITTNTLHRYPYFESSVLCDLFVMQLKLSKSVHNFMLFGFCVLYDHVHLLIQPDKGSDISKVMHHIKRNFTRYANIILGYERIELKPENADNYPRFQGEEPQKHLRDIRIFLSKNKLFYHKYPKFQWQKSYWDHIIRSQQDFNNQLNYIHTNHFKHNLTEDYEYIGYNYQDILN